MASFPMDGSLKWNIISHYMESLMSWPNFITVSSIWIPNVGIGDNNVSIHTKGMFLGHILWPIFKNSMTLIQTILAV
jgi:hypothetical protein